MDTDDTKERVLAGDSAHILAMARTKAHYMLTIPAGFYAGTKTMIPDRASVLHT